MEDLIVYNSIKRIKRKYNNSKYTELIYESTYILNIACKIKPKFISKELGIVIRNFNEEEINYFYPKIQEKIKNIMKLGYEKVIQLEKSYKKEEGELYNMYYFFDILGRESDDIIKNAFSYIYSKSIYENNSLDKKLKISTKENFVDIDLKSEEIARDICSKLLVVDVKDYNKIYNIINKYYNLNKDIVRMNQHTERFIYNLINFCNIIFLETDSHGDEKKFNFKIENLEYYEFDPYKLAAHFDGYIHNLYEDNCISKKIDKIDNTFIDCYIKNNTDNLNNFLFLISQLKTKDNEYYEFNYKEYDLNLVTIIESVLINSNRKVDIKEKFVKNILLCLSVNDELTDYIEEQKIIREIYSYRSACTHGNYIAYKNHIHNLGMLLKYKPEEFEENKISTIEYLISKKLNFYIRNIFEVNSKNNTLVNLLKN